MSNLIDDKISNISKFSQSQIDRLNKQNEAYDHLVSFLTIHIKKVSEVGTLKASVEQELLDRINDPDTEISTSALIALLGILAKKESEDYASILTVLRESTKVTINNIPPPEEYPGRDSNKNNFSQEEMQKARKLLKILDKLETTEFPKDQK